MEENDFVVFLAAISSPDVCEKQYDFARAINVTGTAEFIENCIARGANVLFFSSDVVNGGTLPCSVDETYVGTPIGKYGEMKREIEQRFNGNPHFKVFRLSYVYSRQDKFSRYLDDCAAKGVCAEVFDALYRSGDLSGRYFRSDFPAERDLRPVGKYRFSTCQARSCSPARTLRCCMCRMLHRSSGLFPSFRPRSFSARGPISLRQNRFIWKSC